MTRQWIVAPTFVLAAAVAAAVLSSQAGGQAAPSQSEGKRNVVLIMTDDQTVESMRVMERTRRLVGGRGVTFRNSFVSYSLCCPSRATLLTGQYMHNHGVRGNQAPDGGYGALTDRANLLPGWLESKGYRTIHVGKYLNGYSGDEAAAVPPGWTEWYGAVDPSTYRMWGYTLNENGTHKTYGDQNVEDPALYQTDVYRERALEVIRRNAPGAAPFYLSVAFLAPHSEAARPAGGPSVRPAPRHRDAFSDEALPMPPSFNEADVSDKPASIRNRARLGGRQIEAARARYRARLASLLAVDEAVEAIVAALRDTGQLASTLIVFTADNGFFHGEHRVPNGKVLVYEPSTRIPLLLRGPGIPAGRRSREEVVNVDLAATIRDFADARAGRRLDGRSLLPFARKPSRTTRRPILLETGQVAVDGDLDQDGTPTGAQRRGVNVPTYQAVRTERYVYVHYATGERELYDLRRDPDQLRSRHDDSRYARTRSALRRELRRLATCRGSVCRRDAKSIPPPTR